MSWLYQLALCLTMMQKGATASQSAFHWRLQDFLGQNCKYETFSTARPRKRKEINTRKDPPTVTTDHCRAAKQDQCQA